MKEGATRVVTAGPALSGLEAARLRLDRLVLRARAAELWEAAWPILWRALMVGLVFLAASWLGLWLDLAPVWRMVGLAIFAVLAIVALLPLLRLARLTRRQALARIDREAGRYGPLAHDPASAIEDTLAVGSADPATRALWTLHQTRAAATVARLKAGPPRPDMPRHDPLALRAGVLLAALAAFFVAGPEWRERIGAAFDWREPPPPGPNFRIDGWIDPPLYTRLPPLIVTMNGSDKGAEQRLRAPVNSTLIVRIAGHGDATLTPNAALERVKRGEGPDAAKDTARTPPAVKAGSDKTARSDLREERFRLAGGTAELTVAAAGADAQKLVVETIPDHPPEIERVGNLEVNGRGTFNLTYRAKDDYGIASAEGLVEPTKPGRSLVPPPRIPLALPADSTGGADTKTLVDLTDNPWSGARMNLTLVAKDEAGQEGRTQPAEITLPARIFTQALARSLAEERRRLVTAPDTDRKRVQTALDALMIAPDRFTPQPGIYLGLKTAASRLGGAKTDEELLAVADLLWEMALKIEEGDLSDAEKALRAAQDRLKEAMERGASDQEIKKLTEDLKSALDRFMKEMAERQQKNQKGEQQQSERQQGNQKTVTPDQLNKMIKDMQEAMKRGDTAEAQRLLDQLRDILENLQSAQNGQRNNQSQSEMNKQAQELDKMSREQQQLRDQTFKEGQQQQGNPRQGQRGQQQQQRGQGQQGQQQQGQKGQRGQQQQGQKGQQGQQGQGQQGQGEGDESGQGDTGQQQQALRRRLEDLQRRMKEQGLQGEQGLSDAEDAMKEAEGALGRGQGDQAVDAQGRALEGLKRGAEGMQQQMQQMAEGEGQAEQDGGQQSSPQGQAGAADDDPLGRPTRGKDISDGRVRVPTADESAVQRARRIMEELRRKLGDPSRPQEELDYFERLLRRN